MRSVAGDRPRRWLLLVAAAAMASGGCSDRSGLRPPDALVDQAKAHASGCDANRVANAVGLLPTPELVEAARSGAGARQVRTLAHDQPVSSNYRAQQLNLVLDVDGRIGSVNCG